MLIAGLIALLIFMIAGSSIAAVFAFRVVLSGFSSELLNIQYILVLVKLVIALALILPVAILLVIVVFLTIFRIFGIELKAEKGDRGKRERRD